MTGGERHRLHILAGLALAFVLAGCLPESEHPVAAADPAKNDARLWGAWLSEAEDGYIVAHVFATEDSTLRISVAEHGVEGLGDYLNVMVSGAEAGYLIGKYELDGTDRVSVWFPGDVALERAVKIGGLPGTTKVEGGMTDLRITASPEAWQALLAKPPAGFFDAPLRFQRIGPAYVKQQ
jgi:hypothetical protein